MLNSDIYDYYCSIAYMVILFSLRVPVGRITYMITKEGGAYSSHMLPYNNKLECIPHVPR